MTGAPPRRDAFSWPDGRQPAWQITTMLKQIVNILKPEASARRRLWRLNRRLVEIEQVEARLLLASVYNSGPDGETLTIELKENDTLARISPGLKMSQQIPIQR